jgi:hypothetical protein
VSGIHAARVAARLRQALRIDVTMIAGRYGEYKVLVEDVVLLDAGMLSAIGVLPSSRKVVELVRLRLREIEETAARDPK